jgi:hypothetical protein
MKNNFDDLIREKWEEKQFPVDEQHRQDMLELLESNGRRKTVVFWWIGGLAVTLMIVASLMYLNRNDTTTNPSVPMPSNSQQQTDSFTQNSEESNNETNTGIASATNTNKVEEYTSKNETPARNKSTVSSNKNKGSNKSHTSKSDTGELFPSARNTGKEGDIFIKHESPVAVSKAVAVTIYPESEEVIPSEIITTQRITAYTQPLEPLDLLGVFKSQFGFPGNIQPSSSNYHAVRLFAEAGGGYIPSSKQEYSSGWNLLAGAGLSYHIGSKSALIFSAGYLFQKEGFEFQRTSTVSQPNFGTRSNFNTLTPDKLHFIYSKLGVQYELKRHIFSINGGMQYLYGAEGMIEVNSVDQFTGGSHVSQYGWVSTNGMNRFLWNAEALYGYRVTPRMSLRAGVKYNFSTIKKEDQALTDEGYSWHGAYSSFSPSFIINYHLYGNR